MSADALRGLHLGILIILLSILTIIILGALQSQGTLPALLDTVAAFLTRCPYREITGTPCPLCGTTTATRLLLEGDWSRSLETTPLALLLGPLFVCQLPYRAFRFYHPNSNLRTEIALVLIPIAIGAAMVIAIAHG